MIWVLGLAACGPYEAPCECEPLRRIGTFAHRHGGDGEEGDRAGAILRELLLAVDAHFRLHSRVGDGYRGTRGVALTEEVGHAQERVDSRSCDFRSQSSPCEAEARRGG